MSERGRILEFSSEKRKDSKKETENSIRLLEIVQVVDPSKEPNILVKCELVDGAVQLTGDEAIIKELQEENFFWAGERVTPTDGEKFLQAIKASYRNPYLYARKIN
jgi:hypothetical protein